MKDMELLRVVHNVMCNNVAFSYNVTKEDDGRYVARLDESVSTMWNDMDIITYKGADIDEINKMIIEDMDAIFKPKGIAFSIMLTDPPDL